MAPPEIQRSVDRCAGAHERLLTTIEGLTDADAWQPSLLPVWSVGHVLTHLARNADSLVRMLRGGEQGLVLTQYEGGADSRAADIEAGGGRPANALVADVRMSIFDLEQAWDNASERAWMGRGISVRGELALSTLPDRRWVETEIHHTDLGLGYTPSQWPAEFVRIELAQLTTQWASRRPMGLTDLPPAAMALAPHDRLAWLVGRLDVPGLEATGLLP